MVMMVVTVVMISKVLGFYYDDSSRNIQWMIKIAAVVAAISTIFNNTN